MSKVNLLKLKFVIISPIRNEEITLIKFIESVICQSVLPLKWLFINDNSDDNSCTIINNYKKDYSIIELINYPIKGNRETGGKIVDIINYGISYLGEKNINWDILLKLDCDLIIEKINYFEFILNEFSKNENLGIASGAIYYLRNNKKIYESKYLWNTQGQSKFYRKECLIKMNGLKPFKGWDMIDDIIARGNGFITRKYLEYPILHYYMTQTRLEEGGIFAGIRREALAYRNCSYPLWMFLLKSIKISINKPYIIKGIYFFIYGIYLFASTKPDLSVSERKIIRKFLYQRLLNRIKIE